MEREYTVYKVTSPCGRSYIGYTSLPMMERWRTHVQRATSNYSPTHPFYSAIRKYEKGAFQVTAITTVKTLQAALAFEKKSIAACPPSLRLNLSPGGSDDARFGAEVFWERMRRNPEEREAYIKKLSEAQKRNALRFDYEELQRKAQAWRAEHPKQAYKNTRRASRIASKHNAVKRKLPTPPETSVTPPETSVERKKRLMWKYKNTDARSQNARKIWSNRTEDEHRMIGKKIAMSLKEFQERFTEEERRENTKKARAAIDRIKQGAAASAGLKRYWEELRGDPVRYQEYIERRTKSLRLQ